MDQLNPYILTLIMTFAAERAPQQMPQAPPPVVVQVAEPIVIDPRLMAL